jgi:hypothetical protein
MVVSWQVSDEINHTLNIVQSIKGYSRNWYLSPILILAVISKERTDEVLDEKSINSPEIFPQYPLSSTI